MSKWILFYMLAVFLIAACSQSPDFTSQLRANFVTHLANIDSAAVVDSFRISRVDTMVEKLGRIIDDSIYTRELRRINLQLNNALRGNNKDSIAYYNDEIKYMTGEIDSISHSIASADTKNKFGLIASCAYQISKHDKTRKDSLYYFFDNHMRIFNPGLIDTFIRRSVVKMR